MPLAELPTEHLPRILRTAARDAWHVMLAAADAPTRDWYAKWAQEKVAEANDLARVWAASPWAAEICQRHPTWAAELLKEGSLKQSLGAQDFQAHWQQVAGDGSADALAAALVCFRQREMLRLIWRDFTRAATLEDTCREVGLLAQSCLETALCWHHRALCERFGAPVGDSGAAQNMVVLGMGKLGGEELNLSSDIDLIFCYPEKGETQPPSGCASISNQEFFEILGQRLLAALEPTGGPDIVFRTDMRLRPHGRSGPLALSFNAMELYYESQGRDWERYALVKVRTVAGDRKAGEQLLKRIHPFIYRRYLDFRAVDTLREMKERTAAAEGIGRSEDIKRGPGGIRQVEFTVQSFQIIFGGQRPELRERRLLTALQLLHKHGYLNTEDAKALEEAYRFLRNTEHALQGYADQQTQQLPASAEQQAALAMVMGQPDWDRFSAELAEHRRRVHEIFEGILKSPSAEKSPWQALWQEGSRAEEKCRMLAAAGFQQPREILAHLADLQSRQERNYPEQESRRLAQLMPLLLADLAGKARPDQTLIRILPLLAAILGRSAYLSLLAENPAALKQLVKLCEASPRVAEDLIRYPALLDELLDVRALYAPLERAQIQATLEYQLERRPPEDLEGQLAELHHFRTAHSLRVAAQDLDGRLTIEETGCCLSDIAEAVLAIILDLCWRDLVARHGRPGGPQQEEGAFGIVAYGKLGGQEMQYGSDLDLVFLYEADPNTHTDGKRPLENSIFFTRLGQRLLHYLGHAAAEGALYEVDTRLRPSGRAGMLVTRMEAFTEYQRHKAHTWEHQALIRARAVAGSPRIAEKLTQLKEEILCRRREPEKLRQDVLDMRRKMRAQRAASSGGGRQPDPKRDAGGMVDIEFIVHHAVLAQAAEHPELAGETNLLSLLARLDRLKLLPPGSARALAAAWRALATKINQHTLGGVPQIVLPSLEREVTTWWQQLFAEDTDNTTQGNN